MVHLMKVKQCQVFANPYGLTMAKTLAVGCYQLHSSPPINITQPKTLILSYKRVKGRVNQALLACTVHTRVYVTILTIIHTNALLRFNYGFSNTAVGHITLPPEHYDLHSRTKVL